MYDHGLEDGGKNVSCVSAYGDQVLSCSDGRTGKLWAMHDSNVKLNCIGRGVHRGSVTSCALQGRCVYTACTDGKLVLWDGRKTDEKCLESYKDHSSDVLSIALDGAWLVSGGRDKCVCVYRVAYPNGELTLFKKFEAAKSMVRSVAVSEKLNLIMVGSDDGRIRFFNLSSEDADPVFQEKYHNDWVTGVSLCGETNLAISGSSDGTAVVFDVAFQNEKFFCCKKHTLAHKNPVCSVSTKQGYIAMGAKDGIRLWRESDGKQSTWWRAKDVSSIFIL